MLFYFIPSFQLLYFIPFILTKYFCFSLHVIKLSFGFHDRNHFHFRPAGKGKGWSSQFQTLIQRHSTDHGLHTIPPPPPLHGWLGVNNKTSIYNTPWAGSHLCQSNEHGNWSYRMVARSVPHQQFTVLRMKEPEPVNDNVSVILYTINHTHCDNGVLHCKL